MMLSYYKSSASSLTHPHVFALHTANLFLTRARVLFTHHHATLHEAMSLCNLGIWISDTNVKIIVHSV